MSKLKIAIAGLGFGEKVHIPAIKESNHFNLKYLYHHNKNKIEEIETNTGVKCFGDWNSVVRSDIDGVIIATPPHVRYEFAKEAFQLGINYLGVCCGATPMHIRQVAEAAGMTVPASKYREKMENHFMYGSNERLSLIHI